MAFLSLGLTFCMLGNYARFFVCFFFFFKINFFKNSFSNTEGITVSKSLDPDQAQCFVRPDLGPKFLQRLSADNTSRQGVNKRVPA